MRPLILFRKTPQTHKEFTVCQKYFDVVRHRTECYSFKNKIQIRHVIARYSALPYYKELECDLNSLGCKLMNNYKQHDWIADFQYYNDLKNFTPESWDDATFQYCDYDGPFVVKGRTNSKKFQWNKLMFAETKKDALQIAANLMHDSIIGQQGIIYRKYIPLKTFETGVDNLPFTNEHRLFFYKTALLSHGYYWSNARDTNHILSDEGISFAKNIANIASKHVNFYALDIAETENGDWILIEINDGQMAGLSENDPNVLYSNLAIETIQD